MVFEKTKQSKGLLATVIRAKSSPEGWSMRIDFDNDTGDVLYPVYIEQDVPGITVVMDTQDNTSCTFPPTVPECMIKGIVKSLDDFYDIVAAAKEFIKTECENLIV